MFPTSYEHSFNGFFEFLVLRVNEIDPSQISFVFQMELFIQTTFASPSAWRAFPFDFQSSGHK